MIHIEKLSGTDKRLYRLVGPLVMNRDVIKYNQGYPFKTGEEYIWYIATDHHQTLGFIPVEFRKSEHIINNYYAAEQDHDTICSSLLDALLCDEQEQNATLTVIAQSKHRSLFEEKGFTVIKEWKVYMKMQKNKP